VIVGVLVILMTLPLLEYPVSNDASLYATRLAHSFLYKRNLCNSTESFLKAYGQTSCVFLDSGLTTANRLVFNAQKPENKLLAMKHVVEAPADRASWDASSCEKFTYQNTEDVPLKCTYVKDTTVVYGTRPYFWIWKRRNCRMF
jgi:hypothetical protein